MSVKAREDDSSFLNNYSPPLSRLHLFTHSGNGARDTPIITCLSIASAPLTNEPSHFPVFPHTCPWTPSHSPSLLSNPGVISQWCLWPVSAISVALLTSDEKGQVCFCLARGERRGEEESAGPNPGRYAVTLCEVAADTYPPPSVPARV